MKTEKWNDFFLRWDKMQGIKLYANVSRWIGEQTENKKKRWTTQQLNKVGIKKRFSNNKKGECRQGEHKVIRMKTWCSNWRKKTEPTKHISKFSIRKFGCLGWNLKIRTNTHKSIPHSTEFQEMFGCSVIDNSPEGCQKESTQWVMAKWKRRKQQQQQAPPSVENELGMKRTKMNEKTIVCLSAKVNPFQYKTSICDTSSRNLDLTDHAIQTINGRV